MVPPRLEDEPDGRAGSAWKAAGSGNWLGFEFSVLRLEAEPGRRLALFRKQVGEVTRWGSRPLASAGKVRRRRGSGL